MTTHINKPQVTTDTETLLRQNAKSYCVAPLWSAGYYEGQGWQVFYRGIDANFRLGVGQKREADAGFHRTFREAANWIERLDNEEIEAITVKSVAGN